MSMPNKMTIRDIPLKGKRVLVRCDFNVPLRDGKITNDTRIVESLPTIQYLIEKEARIILCSHLGRPKDGPDKEFSMAPVADRLSELLHQQVRLASDVVGPSARKMASMLQNGKVMLLENVRFHKEETANDPVFAKRLADLAEIYVNDAFGTAHRAHASTAGVAEYLPAVCGLLIEKEITVMGGALEDPKRPFVAILGGAKVSDKIGVIENLLDKVDTLIVGGGMAFTFLKAKGYEIGTSLCEQDKVELAAELMKRAQKKKVQLLLPTDIVVAEAFDANAEHGVVKAEGIPADWMGLDIGPASVQLFEEAIAGAGTVLWNGPMGVFEMPAFAKGTNGVARAIAESEAISIIGGGDSIAAVEQLGYKDRMTHISTGGGASLEFLEGKVLPGIACLRDREEDVAK